jgi:hypothetical protein
LQSTPERLGAYELIGRIASGGMAEVYLARRSGLMGFEKFLVVKRILPHLATDPEFVSMFLDEARIAAALNHPNVVHIYDLGEADGSYFIVMEYLEGQSMSAVLKRARRRGRAPAWSLVARVVAEAAAGLHAAHELRAPSGEHLGLVHRDVSPQNILALYNGGVKLLDFGVAKARGRLTRTTSRSLKGKYGYMSPEQALGREVDRRSDVFALGIVLWECLALKRLFHSESELAILKAITERPAPPPTRYNPHVPVELEHVALRALSIDPAGRFATADEMRRALEACLMKLGTMAGASEVAEYLASLFGEELARRREVLALAARGELPAAPGARSMFEVLAHEPAGAGSRPSAVRSAPGTMGLPGPVAAAKPVFTADDEDEEEGAATDSPDVDAYAPVAGGPATIPERYGAEASAAYAGAGARGGERRRVKSGLSHASGEVLSALIRQQRARGLRLALAAGAIALFLVGGAAAWVLSTPSGPAPPAAGAGVSAMPLEPEVETAPARGTGPGAATDTATDTDTHAATATDTRTAAATDTHAATATDTPAGTDTHAAAATDIPTTGTDTRTATDTPPATGTRTGAEAATATDADAASASAPSTAGDADKTAARAKPAGPALGFLNLDTVPWTDVYLGKRKLGTTPLVKAKLPAGTLTLTLVNKASGIRVTKVVTIKSGKVSREKLKL